MPVMYGGHGVTELVLTSRYHEETTLRALPYFAFNVSLFLERIPFSQSSQRTAKLAALGRFLRRAAPTCWSYTVRSLTRQGPR